MVNVSEEKNRILPLDFLQMVYVVLYFGTRGVASAPVLAEVEIQVLFKCIFSVIFLREQRFRNIVLQVLKDLVEDEQSFRPHAIVGESCK